MHALCLGKGGSNPQGTIISRNRHNATDLWHLNPPTDWCLAALSFSSG